MARTALLRALAVILLLLLVPSAQAHARPVQVEPQAGERLHEPPRELRIRFNEPINPRGTSLELFDANGTRLALGPLRFESRTDVRSTAALNESDAAYIVRWSTYSLVDGHRMAGAWSFAVGNATPLDVGELAPSRLDGSGVLARLLAYGGLIGMAALGIARLGGFQPGRKLMLTTLSLAGLFLSSAFLFLRSVEATGVLSDEYSRRVAAQVALSVAIAATILIRSGRSLAWTRGALIVLWVALQGLSSHAAAAFGGLGASLDAAHLLSVTLWMGLVLALWLRPNDPGFEAQAKAWSKAAVASAAIAVSTGLALLFALTLGSGRTLTTLPFDYGLVLSYKLLAAFTVLGFGAFNQLRHVRRLAFGTGSTAPLRANLRRELLAAGVVLLLASIIATLDPKL